MMSPDTQVANCCRSIIRLILNGGFTEGMKLPSQGELCTELGFSHNSMSPAMTMLVESGMIVRKTRLGTLVQDSTAQPAGLWRIALPFGFMDGTAGNQFSSLLVRYLQEKSHQAGLVLRYYLLNAAEAKVISHSLEHFGLLPSDIEAGRIDGVLSPAFLSARAAKQLKTSVVPFCSICGIVKNASLVFLNDKSLLTQAIDELACQGAERITVMGPEIRGKDICPLLEPGVDFFGWQEGVRTADLATQLQAFPSKERPDGLIILNDVIALELTSLLVHTDYRPHIAVQANRQMPLYYSLPVIKFEYDVEALAEIGVNLMMEKVARCDLTPKAVAVDAVKILPDQEEPGTAEREFQ